MAAPAPVRFCLRSSTGLPIRGWEHAFVPVVPDAKVGSGAAGFKLSPLSGIQEK